MRSTALTIACAMAVAFAACGSSGPHDTEDQIAAFCQAYSQIDANGGPSVGFNDPNGLQARAAYLQDQLDAVDAGAPPSLHDAVAITKHYRALSSQDQYKPSEQSRNNKAQKSIEHYASSKCHFND